MSKKNFKFIIFGAIAVILVAVIIVTVAVVSDYNGSSRNGDICKITIPQGSSVSAIANILEENGAIDSALAFRIYSKLASTESKYRFGSYEFKNDIGFEEITKLLATKGQKAETKKVTIPEGTGIYDYTKNVNKKNVTVPGIATLLEKAGVCDKESFFEALKEVPLDSKLLKNANSEKAYVALEGYLFPDTYEFYVGEDSKKFAKLAIEKMIKKAEEVITDDMYKRATELGYTMNEILTMASIVQMESGQNSSEMANVAGVFYNRLKSSPTSSLGSSPTIYYGDAFKNDDGRYHTQADNQFMAISGFPPGPLCSPGEAAIKAALYPTENTPYFYFVTDKNGKFYYHKTSAEQSITINRLQSEGNWIYEYFN